jgi:hypothetical protein
MQSRRRDFGQKDMSASQILSRHLVLTFFVTAALMMPMRAASPATEANDSRVELADQPGTFYINTLSWAGNSDEVCIDKLSRSRGVREVLVANPQTGVITQAYSATDPAWVVSWVDMESGGLEWVAGW